MQIDPGSAINRMPLRALAHQGIPTSKLSHTKMTIQGYNADSQRAIGKIRLKCQLADLKSEITSYVIDNDTSYNLLLGRPWIHGNFFVPSTLYQCFKYVDEDKKSTNSLRRSEAGVEAYCADSKPASGDDSSSEEEVIFSESYMT